MIKKFLSIESKFKYCLHWIFIYIVVVVIGISVTLVATYLNNTHMQDIAHYDYMHYEKTEEFNPNVAVNGAHNIIYDNNHQEVQHFPKSKTLDFSNKQINGYFTRLETNDCHYAIRFHLRSEHKIAIVVAYPMDDDGMFLFYREPPFVNKTIIIICVMIGIIIVMMASYMYLIMSMAQKNQKMQRDYVDNITHELKSPIASVKALTETMYDGLIREEEKRKRYYKIILHEMTGLENTVTNMLELSKIQNNQIDCSKSVLSNYEVFGGIIEKYAALCDERNMRFSIKPEISSHIMLYTNKSLAARIMDILLDNAIKFANRENGSICVEFEDNDRMITVSIIDNGTGILPDDQNLIFSRFYKGDKSHNEKGSGLGLSIATEIANSLGEKLWIKYTGSEGTAFAFTIHKH